MRACDFSVSERLPLHFSLRRVLPLDFQFLLCLGDLVALACAFSLAVALRFGLGNLFSGLPPFGWREVAAHLERSWLFTPLFIGMLLKGLYERRLPFWEETREILRVVFWGMIAVFALVSLGKMSFDVSRLTIALTGVFSAVLVPLLRAFYKPFLFSFKRYSSAALVLGAGRSGRALAACLGREKYMGYRVVGFLDDDVRLFGREFEGLRVYGPIRQMGKFVRLMGVDTVFVAGASFSPRRLAEIYALSQRMVKEFFLVPEFYGLGMLNAEISCLLDQRLSMVRIRNNLLLPFNRLVKRFMDIFLVLLSFPLLLPFMGLIALLIKLDSPGPVFFRQPRVGEGGRIFSILKFRTMHPGSDRLLAEHLRTDSGAAVQWRRFRKLRNDPRVTRVGRFLRKYSLDELPQVFNVLRGEMSLVGPRPVTEEECRNYYREQVGFYLSVKPGLTGLWQVSGRNLLPYEERVKLDTWYVLNWSLWLDLVILVRTVGVVISQRGSF